jgi:ACS family hexuronate transporter-like MFS transporter
MAISYVDRQALSVLAPLVTRDLKIGEVEYGWLASAFSMAYAVGAPFAGRLIGRVGPVRGLLSSVLVWSFVAALHSFCPGFEVLFLLRIALGLAESPAFPGAAITVDRALQTERARGMGILFTGSSFGSMVAPPMASWLSSHFGWRAAFLGTAACGLLWVPAWLWVTSLEGARAAIEPKPSESDANTSASPNTNPAESARSRAATLSTLQHPETWRALAAVVATAPIGSFVLLWGAKLLVSTYKLRPEDAGYYLWLPPLIYDASSVFFGDRAARRNKAGNGVSLSDLGFAGVVLACSVALVPRMSSPWGASILLGVAFAGVGALYALSTSEMFSRLPSEAVPLASGLLPTAQSVAYFIAGPLIGRSVKLNGDYRQVALVLALWAIPGALYWIGASHSKPSANAA